MSRQAPFKIPKITVVDVSAFTQSEQKLQTHELHNAKQHAASKLAHACKESGFFYLSGHNVSEDLQERLESLSKVFFALPESEKMKIRMENGGRAWRGYFPVGSELTSGKPDLKEGIYFGEELSAHHPLVKAHAPLHGANLFPDNHPKFKDTVLEYIEAMTRLGHQVTAALALSLGLPEDYFFSRYTENPLVLFRIFIYPVPEKNSENSVAQEQTWGVAEHTDYGFLTLLKQDNTGGLQIKSQGHWIEAPPFKNTFVCNIGDMLERMTGGLYLSTPHRVRNKGSHDRLSFPFFFDPAFTARVKAIEGLAAKYQPDAALSDGTRRAQNERWDKENVHAFEGTYGDYLQSKIAKVFPRLFAATEL